MYNYDCTPCLALCVHILKNEKNNIIISSTYIKSTLFRSMNISQSLPTKQKFFLTRTFIGVRLSGLRRSCTLESEVEERLTFSFCTQKEGYKHIYISVVITIVTQSNTAKFIRMLNVEWDGERESHVKTPCQTRRLACLYCQQHDYQVE